MTNNPEIFLEIVEELGYDPMAMEPPHEHTIRIPGCVRCDLAEEEAKQSKKRPARKKPSKALVKK